VNDQRTGADAPEGQGQGGPKPAGVPDRPELLPHSDEYEGAHELSYAHAEGYAAGEMKHGPIALIDEHMPVVVVMPHDGHYEKTFGSVQEAARLLRRRSQGADVDEPRNLAKIVTVE
jgi:hypothetical protein